MRIAIVKLSAMGDIVHAMIVLQFIKKFNNKISIDWIVEERFKDLLKSNPHINELHLVNFKDAKKNKSILVLLRGLNKLRNHDIYDLVIDMQGLLKSAIISKLLPSKQIIGFDKFSSRERIASNFYNKRFNCPYEANVILRNISLIEFALGFRVEKQQIYNKVPFIYSNEKQIDIKKIKSKKNILIIPGASHPSKRYPVEGFVKLVQLLEANYIILWGNSEEELLAKEIKKRASDVKICPKLSIEKLASIISQLDLVIGPDTGPTHIAWALNIPSITLYGPTPGYRNTFETEFNKIIESDSNVNPNMIDKNDYSIRNIEAENIVMKARELLVLEN
ncbi:lipopolysaccharide heptosyltransferase I [Candidatus Pseudothioglobus singularis]|nr:lipopolysaccharide heptosyltransferase I [Candidatus Pseudothioglobus singularis]